MYGLDVDIGWLASTTLLCTVWFFNIFKVIYFSFCARNNPLDFLTNNNYIQGNIIE